MLDTEGMLDREQSVCWIEMCLEGFCMFGHHESAQATVLYAQDVTGSWEDVHHVKIEFVLEVRPPAGQVFRAKATHHFIMFTDHPQVGDVVNVKYNPKSLEAELDLKDDIRYGELGLKHKEQAQRQAAQVQRDALLSAPPGTPLASAGGARRNLDPELQALVQQAEEFERRAKQGAPANSAGGALDPELQELLRLEEAERQAKLAGGQQTPGIRRIMPPGVPGMAAPTNLQTATGPAEMQMLRQELEYTGASGQAKILRKQQAGTPVQYFTPFFVEVQVQPDNMGFPFTSSFTTWIDTSKGMLMEGYTLPVKYDPQNPARIVFLLPA
ncbi:MAG TPA: hypothetical protein VF099_09650 [Ktedonobacterales bacterium]